MIEILLYFMVRVNEVVVLSLPWWCPPHLANKKEYRTEASNQNYSETVQALFSLNMLLSFFFSGFFWYFSARSIGFVLEEHSSGLCYCIPTDVA